MTEAEALVERMRALDAKATAGPWYTLDPPWLPSGTETSILAESPDPHVARFICDFDLWALDDEADAARKSECPDADADLIVAIRNALPDLLTLIERQAARIEAAEAMAGALNAVSDAMLRDANDAPLGYGWNIGKLNEARPLIYDALAAYRAGAEP